MISDNIVERETKSLSSELTPCDHLLLDKKHQQHQCHHQNLNLLLFPAADVVANDVTEGVSDIAVSPLPLPRTSAFDDYI